MPYPLTATAFKAAYVVFADLDDTQVQPHLDAAARRTPEGVWGDRAEDGHGLLTAHLIAISPLGRDARLKSDDGETTWGMERRRMEDELGPAVTPRVT